jgi:ferritin-like metal-binding protein YciE
MNLLTLADVQQWQGLGVQDPYGEPLGQVVEVLCDADTGAPEWLLVAAPAEDQGRPVPIAGAELTGRKVRVVPTAATIRTASAVRVGADIDPELKEQLARNYGLQLDGEASPTGLLRTPAEPAPPPAPDPPAVTEEGRSQLITLLREAHAMEQASLRMLAAMRRRSRDEELVHDLALHHKASNRHAEDVRVRLGELEAPRARPLDWLAKLLAYVRAQLGRARSTPEPHDLAEAYEFEQGEIALYDRLRGAAERHGDAVTAGLATRIKADEVAMVATLRNFRLRVDPGFRRGQESPFSAPPELAGIAPES